jgi:acetyl esterase/lipase
MNMTVRLAVNVAFFTLAGSVFAEVPPALAERLAAIGPVINPGATAPLYAPQFTEKEPYMSVNVERDVAYGPAERHLLDVFTPARSTGTHMPVLVFVHGGAFVAGNRRTGPGSPFYDNVMLWATQHDMVGVNMTYRLAPQNPWPAGPQDIAQALRWVKDNIGRRGGDPVRVFLLGHSAGASHVAAYVARPEFHAAGSSLAGAMLLSGVYRVRRKSWRNHRPTLRTSATTVRSTPIGRLSTASLRATRRCGWARRSSIHLSSRRRPSCCATAFGPRADRSRQRRSQPTATCRKPIPSTATTERWVTPCGRSSRRIGDSVGLEA